MKRERGDRLTEILMKYLRIKVDDRGRIYIPKHVRKKFLIKEGDVVYVTIDEEGFKVRTTSAVAKELKDELTRLSV